MPRLIFGADLGPVRASSRPKDGIVDELDDISGTTGMTAWPRLNRRESYRTA